MGSACRTPAPDLADLDNNISSLLAPSIQDTEEDKTDPRKGGENSSGYDTESLRSGSSGASRPPTPFSRPVTAAIMLRPKTTTISERAELNMEETGEEVVEDIVEETPSQSQLHPHKLKRCSSRNGMELGAHRQLSRNITEDDEDIIKIKEYMEQKGL